VASTLRACAEAAVTQQESEYLAALDTVRTFGVDANGNQLETRLFGDRNATTFITSFSAFDARNRKVARPNQRTDPTSAPPPSGLDAYLLDRRPSVSFR